MATIVSPLLIASEDAVQKINPAVGEKYSPRIFPK